MALKTLMVGLGKQAQDDHLPAITYSDNFDLIGVCDVDQETADSVARKYKTEGFYSIERALSSLNPDVAVVAVPHDQYTEVIPQLAERGIHIIKEKPLAVSTQEARQLLEITKNVFLGVITQRRFNPIYQAFLQVRRHIGKIYSVEGRYTMNVGKLDEGWRSEHMKAGGSALIDMGYHFIDLLVWYMGIPKSVTARVTRGNRIGQEDGYNVEDTANLLFDFYLPQSYAEKTIGNFLISRVHPEKSELLVVYGTKGIIELKRGQLRRLTTDGKEIEKLVREQGWPSAIVDQMDHFAEAIENGVTCSEETSEHLKHVAIIEAAYESDKSAKSCKPEEYLKEH